MTQEEDRSESNRGLIFVMKFQGETVDERIMMKRSSRDRIAGPARIHPGAWKPNNARSQTTPIFQLVIADCLKKPPPSQIPIHPLVFPTFCPHEYIEEM